MSENIPYPRPGNVYRHGVYIPPRHLFSPEFRIQQERVINLAPGWLFDFIDYDRMRQGHEATDADAWTCYLSGPTDGAPAGNFHAHHMATGREVYRMPLEGDGIIYLARTFVVEQGRAKNRLAGEEGYKNALARLLENVIEAPPARFDV